MKDEKYSIDNLIIFVIVACFILLAGDMYIRCYPFMLEHKLANPQIGKFLMRMGKQFPIIYNGYLVKTFTFFFMVLASLAIKVKKSPGPSDKITLPLTLLLSGTLFFVLSPLLTVYGLYVLYIVVTVVLWVLLSYAIFSLRKHFTFFRDDLFNDRNEDFQQEKKCISNDYSVNLKTDKGWINVVNPFRATMVMGTPGSGKSYSVIEEFIRQHIEKQFSMVVYDFKFPDLAKETYNFYCHYKSKYKVAPEFSVVCFEKPEYSDFINPIDPAFLNKSADAIEAAQTVLYNLNKEWITQKDFFAQSAVSYFAACIYYLKLYDGGRFCTLPHAIALAAAPDEKVFKLLSTHKELRFFLAPFADALEKKAFEQLAGQTASARIPLSLLASRELFWVMGNNVLLDRNTGIDVNNPDRPRIMILANSPASQSTNSPALGLIVTQLIKNINTKKRMPCSLIIDELPTMYFMGLDNLIATARSNKISTTVGIQDLEQLKRDYGEEVAETIFNIVGNIFSGAVRNDTANKLQETFGKIKHNFKTVSVETTTTSYSINETLDYVIPAAKIAQLSQGEFVGVISDNFGEELERKIFRGAIKVDKRDHINRVDLPLKHYRPDFEMLLDQNYQRIIEEIDIIIDNELFLQEQNEQQEIIETTPEKMEGSGERRMKLP
jgi:hypothetical protein